MDKQGTRGSMVLALALLTLPAFSFAGMKDAAKLEKLLLCGVSGSHPKLLEVHTELLRQLSAAGVAVLPEEAIASAFTRSEEEYAAVRGKTAPGAEVAAVRGKTAPGAIAESAPSAEVAAVRGKTAPGMDQSQIQAGNPLPPGDPLMAISAGPKPSDDSIGSIASQAWKNACPRDAGASPERWLKLVEALGADGWAFVDVESGAKGKTSLGFKFFDKYGKQLWAGKPASSGKNIPDAVQKSVQAIYK